MKILTLSFSLLAIAAASLLAPGFAVAADSQDAIVRRLLDDTARKPNLVAQTPPPIPAPPTPLTPAVPPAPSLDRLLPNAATTPTPTPIPAAAPPTPGVPAPSPIPVRPARPPGFQAVPAVPGGQPAPAPPPGPGQVAPGAGGVAAAAAPPTGTNVPPAPAGSTFTATSNDPSLEELLPPGLIKFQDAELAQVLDIYQELTGRTVLKPNSLPAAKISIKTQTALTRREAIQALDSILSLNQITMVPQGEKFVKAVPQAQAGQEGLKFNDLPSSGLPESGTMVTHIARLSNAVPNEVAQALQPFAKMPNSILVIPSAGIIVFRDYAENVKRMLEILEKIDVVPPQDFESVVIPIKYALAGDVAQVLGSLTQGGGGGVTVGRQQTRSGLSGGGGGFGGGGGLGGQGGFGQPGFGNQGFNQQQQGLQAGGLGGQGAGRSAFADRLRNIVNRAASGPGGSGDIFVLGTTKIIADERINALLIFASKQDLIMISNIIEKIDVVLAQVLIEAAIIEVNVNDSLEYGFSYLQKQASGNNSVAGIGALKNHPNFLSSSAFSGQGSNSLSSGFSYLASFRDFDATITAFAGNGRGRVLQRPRIQTSHAVEANLFVGQTRPYPTGSSFGFGGSYNSIQQLQIGVTLSVLPLINADGLVVMDIRQKIQDVGENVEIANVGKVPSTVDREANAKVAVRDRETIMVGGLIRNEKKDSKSGVPILKDIPLLGALFRSTSESFERRELIVLLRPTVLPTPQDASVFAAEERGRMPSTRTAEIEFEIMEQKRLEKANRELYKKEGLLR